MKLFNFLRNETRRCLSKIEKSQRYIDSLIAGSERDLDNLVNKTATLIEDYDEQKKQYKALERETEDMKKKIISLGVDSAEAQIYKVQYNGKMNYYMNMKELLNRQAECIEKNKGLINKLNIKSMQLKLKNDELNMKAKLLSVNGNSFDRNYTADLNRILKEVERDINIQENKIKLNKDYGISNKDDDFIDEPRDYFSEIVPDNVHDNNTDVLSDNT